MPEYRPPINDLELMMVPLEIIYYRYDFWGEGIWRTPKELDGVYAWSNDTLRQWLINGVYPCGDKDFRIDERRIRIRIKD